RVLFRSHVGRRRAAPAPRAHDDDEARRENATAARARRNHPRGGAVAQRPRPSTYGLALHPARRTRSRQREHMSEHAPGVGAPSAAVSAFSPSPAGPPPPSARRPLASRPAPPSPAGPDGSALPARSPTRKRPEWAALQPGALQDLVRAAARERALERRPLLAALHELGE